MKYSPETLMQIFMNGSMTTEAQTAFDRLMRENPEFSEKVTQAMAERMGPVPVSTVEDVTNRLDAKFESLWVKNKPSRSAQFLHKGSKILLVLGIVGLAAYLIATLWPKLMAILPQIDLAHTTPSVQSEPKSDLAPPAMAAPTLGHHRAPALPALVKSKKAASAPTAATTVPPAARPNYNVQTGNSIRLVVDNDKTQNVDVTVLSSAGGLIRHLYLGQWSPGSHFVDWDGKADNGVSVAPGNYTVVVKTGTKTQSGIVTIK